jgi:hypothetical protein
MQAECKNLRKEINSCVDFHNSCEQAIRPKGFLEKRFAQDDKCYAGSVHST